MYYMEVHEKDGGRLVYAYELKSHALENMREYPLDADEWASVYKEDEKEDIHYIVATRIA
jgi:hypothetical protein